MVLCMAYEYPYFRSKTKKKKKKGFSENCVLRRFKLFEDEERCPVGSSVHGFRIEERNLHWNFAFLSFQ